MMLRNRNIAGFCKAACLVATMLVSVARAAQDGSCPSDQVATQSTDAEATKVGVLSAQRSDMPVIPSIPNKAVPLLAPAAVENVASCFVTVSDISAKSRQLVDVRSSSAFGSLQAVNSLNIPVGALTHVEFLKPTAILLFGDGKSDHELSAVCEPLKASGFKDVRVLRGGLRALHLAGYPMVGSPRAVETLYSLNSKELHSLVGRDKWKVLVTKSDAAETTRLGIRVNAAEANASAVSNRLKTLLKTPSGSDWIVIGVSASEASGIRNGLAEGERDRVLFYTEPIRAYASFLQQQTTILAEAGKPLVRPCNQL
jgi:rhodanese-related sulfurtransferase